MLILKRMQSTGNLKKFSQALRTVHVHSFVEFLRGKRPHAQFYKQLPPIPTELRWMPQSAFEFEGKRSTIRQNGG